MMAFCAQRTTTVMDSGNVQGQHIPAQTSRAMTLHVMAQNAFRFPIEAIVLYAMTRTIVQQMTIVMEPENALEQVTHAQALRVLSTHAMKQADAILLTSCLWDRHVMMGSSAPLTIHVMAQDRAMEQTMYATIILVITRDVMALEVVLQFLGWM